MDISQFTSYVRQCAVIRRKFNRDMSQQVLGFLEQYMKHIDSDDFDTIVKKHEEAMAIVVTEYGEVNA